MYKRNVPKVLPSCLRPADWLGAFLHANIDSCILKFEDLPEQTET